MASAADLRLARADGRITFAAGNASILAGFTRLDVQNGRLELVRREGRYRVGAISADSVEAQITVPGGQDPAVPRGKALPVPLAGAPWARGPLAGTLRNTLLGAARAADLVLDASAGIRIQGVHAMSPNESLDLSAFVGHRAELVVAGSTERRRFPRRTARSGCSGRRADLLEAPCPGPPAPPATQAERAARITGRAAREARDRAQ